MRNVYFKHTQGGFVASLVYQNVNSLETDGPRMDNKREENIAWVFSSDEFQVKRYLNN